MAPRSGDEGAVGPAVAGGAIPLLPPRVARGPDRAVKTLRRTGLGGYGVVALLLRP
jgi:hypothetical protein